MTTELALTFIGSQIYAAPYDESLPSQRFELVKEENTLVSIRNKHLNLVLEMSDTILKAVPYSGSSLQSFRIEEKANGTSIIRAGYYSVALELTKNGFEPQPYDPGHLDQHFNLVANADKTVSICFSPNLVFNTFDKNNDLKGKLSANVKFAQSQVIPATLKANDVQPHLVANRRTLLLVKPLQTVYNLEVSVLDAQSKVLGRIALNPPEDLPKTAYYSDFRLPDHISFTPRLDSLIYSLDRSSEVKKLSDTKAAYLHKIVEKNDIIDIRISEGFAENIYLPNAKGFEGKIIRIYNASESHYKQTIFYNEIHVALEPRQTVRLQSISGEWFSEEDVQNQKLLYAENTWSVELPSKWIQPDIQVLLHSGQLDGELVHPSPCRNSY